MPSPELARQLADLGAVSLLILLLLVISIGLYRQWWVPGWVWKAERERRLRAEAAAERATKALARYLARERRSLSRRPNAADEAR